jgi:hypothetical protein
MYFWFFLRLYMYVYIDLYIGNVNEERETNRYISRDRSLLIDLTNVNDLEKNCPYQAGSFIYIYIDTYLYMYIYIFTYVPIHFWVYIYMFVYLFQDIVLF